MRFSSCTNQREWGVKINTSSYGQYISCPQCGRGVYISSVSCYCGWKPGPTLKAGRTQKLKGLLSLGFYFPTISPTYTFHEEGEPAKDGLTDSILSWSKMFARPCPVRPRHGFVDSRLVTSLAELDGVIKETLIADPGGEVMLVPFHQSTWNAVWTPSCLSIGKGHDGATCGKDTLNIPLSGRHNLNPTLIEKAGIGKEEWPYIEAVMGADKAPQLTQLRAGPIGDSKRDYIPSPTSVEEIITVDTSSSLLEWEERIKGLEGKKGVVVSHIGGSLVDHFSVHARSFQIPVITTRPIEVGEVLEPLGEIPPDPEAILKGLAVGEAFPLNINENCGNAVAMLLFALHNSASLEGEGAFWVGVGASLMMRLGGTALKGEARHINNNKGPRYSVYARVLNNSLRRQRAALPRNVHILRYGQFGGNSVGGRKWALCGAATAKLFDAVGELASHPSQETVGVMMRAYNNAVNQAHNGGWWLNKFGSQDLFTQLQEGDLMPLLNLIPMFEEIEESRRTISSTIVERKVGVWKTWVPLKLAPIKVSAAEITLIPGISGMNFKIKDRLLKDKHKGVNVSFEKLFESFSTLIGKENIYVVTGEEGLRVEIRRPHLDPLLIWEEEKLEGSAMPSKGE